MDYLLEYIKEKERADKAENLLSQLMNGRDLRRASHIRDLGEKVKKLRRTVRHLQECAESKNNQLYATGLIVNCTGCEAGRPCNAENLTEEKVQQVELIARRLRVWWNNHNWRHLKRKQKRGLFNWLGIC